MRNELPIILEVVSENTNEYRSDVNEFLKISEIEEIIKKEKKIEDG